ncbi:ABC transporter substrate-binding protein [Roseiarcaceae bacterium H3SJ34-1]|uniref:ABC transporter substrate-binding protein n=1 Tax=Terripilifer ovatus TaxID=3032367 RepID=UPI003AB9373E|nr:ABC transporter substrate-binding protein [Roseiarcaceae bacterium H3SJ34-1]
MKKPVQSLLASVFAAGLGVTGISMGAAQAQETVKIGVIEPLTGGVAFDGMSFVKGAQLAEKEINAAGGLLGKKLELVVADGVCRPAESVSAAEKLITSDKVPVMIGAFCSGATQAVMPVAERSKIPLVTGTSSLPRLTEVGNKWFFRNTEKDTMEAAAFSNALINDLKFKTVFYVAANDDWGRGSVDSFKKTLEGLGAKTVGVEFFDQSATDFYTLLTKVRGARPDLVFLAAYTQSAATALKQAKELGVESKIFGIGAVTTPTFLKLAGDAAHGLLAGVAYASSIPGAENAKFVAAYKAANGEDPSKYAMFGYNTTHVVGEAIKRAGAADPEKIREALAATDYLGPTGRVHFDDKGQGYGFSLYLVELTPGGAVVRASKEIDKAAAQ